jgi:hypothetical protein
MELWVLRHCYFCNKDTKHNCNGNCIECGGNNYPSCTICDNDSLISPLATFNYECPDCHGRFNQPAIDYCSSSANSCKCPFCGRKMQT